MLLEISKMYKYDLDLIIEFSKRRDLSPLISLPKFIDTNITE